MHLNLNSNPSGLLKTIFFFCFLFMFNGNIFSQSAVKKMIGKKTEALKKVKSKNPFTGSPNKIDKVDKAIKGKKEWLNIDPDFSKKIIKGKDELLKMTIPIKGSKPLQLELQKVDVLTESFKLNAVSNKDQAIDKEMGSFYWGVVEGYENSTVAINIFNEEVSGTIDTGEETFTLAKIENTNSNKYILYQEKDLEEQPTLSCSTGDIKEDLIDQVETQAKLNPNPDNCVRLYVEVDYDLFSHFGSVAATYNYIAGAFSQVGILYANESINITLNQVLIWDTEDPYTGPSTSNYLNQFSAAVSGGFNGDLAHLVGTKGGGGIAYLNALCGNKKTAYSGINTSYQDVPSFSWTIKVLTHELGHNLGSPHTHACSWNGNNTQIDDCGNIYTNSTSACYDAENPIIPQEGGTIMSYCHLNSVGVDFSLGFGQQPGDLIRNNVYASACLSACEECLEVGNSCDDGNPCTINDVIDSYCNCTGITTPDNDQDGFCGANDPDDNDPCVPTSCDNCTLTTISITGDQYPGETSWEIVDANGVVLFSGNGYTGTPATEIREVCIPDGCYDFIIKDQYGDGMCCTYGNGNYSVTDDTGNVIASGGEFGTADMTAFCYDNTSGGCTAETPCDDGNACTTNDVLDANCNCAGTIADADNDGVCDADDICPNGDDSIDTDGDGTPDACDDCSIIPGTSCNDGDDCTTNDIYDANCNCAGTFADTDSDGVCDANDLCSSGDDNIDTDGDGIPDACDNCSIAAGTSCDDGNACTTEDVYDANCNCTGTLADADNDGVCDADDICPNGNDNIDTDGDGTPDACDDCNFLPGTSCDDGDDCTDGDLYDANCNCIGTIADADADGICDGDDICANGDDNIDTDGDGIPDACDFDCDVQTVPFIVGELVHQGTGATSTTMIFTEMTREVSFVISELHSKLNGKTKNRFIDKVEITYINESGNTVNYGTFLGRTENTIQVNISEGVQSITISLSDDYDGDATSPLSISFSSVSLCAPPCADDDNDGVCNVYDQCIESDDRIDEDGDNIPDGCDDCFDVVTPFSIPQLTHSGTGNTQITVELGGQENPIFTISELSAKENGKPTQKHIDAVEVRYIDTDGNDYYYQTYSGANQNTAEVSLMGNIQSITVILSDDLDGDGTDLSVSLSDVTACGAPALGSPEASIQFVEEETMLKVYPNPTSGKFIVQFDSFKGRDYEVVVTDAFGFEHYRRPMTADTKNTTIGIDSQRWQEGMYFVWLKNSKQKLQVKRVVIAKE